MAEVFRRDGSYVLYGRGPIHGIWIARSSAVCVTRNGHGEVCRLLYADEQGNIYVRLQDEQKNLAVHLDVRPLPPITP